MAIKIGNPFWKTEDDLSEEQQEKLRKIEQEEKNRRAQGFLCCACRFYKPKASTPDEGKCLKSFKGEKNESKLFNNCGGPRIVYGTECHNCFKQIF